MRMYLCKSNNYKQWHHLQYMQGIAPKHILLIGSHVRLSRWPTNLAVSPINLLSTTSNSNDAWTPELDRPQADSYGHFLSTLNPSHILFSDYYDVSANRTRHSYATLFTALVSMSRDLNRDSEGFYVRVGPRRIPTNVTY